LREGGVEPHEAEVPAVLFDFWEALAAEALSRE